MPFRNIASAVADDLRERALSAPADALLGSEQELSAEFGVSVPTLRQAARILESEGVLAARRGVNGGYFAQVPRSEVVSRMASVYLRAQHTTIEDLLQASSVTTPLIARLAADNPSADERRTLATWVSVTEDGDATPTEREFLTMVRGFTHRLGEICRNPPLALLADVIVDLAFLEHGVRPFRAADHIEQTRTLHFAIAEAVAEGDCDQAEALTRRLSELGREWTGQPGRLLGPATAATAPEARSV